jgi:hypothetical protein
MWPCCPNKAILITTSSEVIVAAATAPAMIDLFLEAQSVTAVRSVAVQSRTYSEGP